MTNATSVVGGFVLSETTPLHSSRKLNWGRWLVLALSVVSLALFVLCGPSEGTIIQNSLRWREAARAHLVFALGIYVLAEVVLIAFSAPVGIWLTALAGFLFGTWVGTAVVNLGATIGAVLAFLSARYVLAGAIRRAAETRPNLQRRLNAFDEGFRLNGAYYVLLVRLVPAVPFFVANLALGLTSVRLRDYWWASQIGMLPVTLVVTSTGAGLAEITSFREVLSLKVLGVLCLLPLIPFLLHHALSRWHTSSR